MPWGRLDDHAHVNAKLASFSDKAHRVWFNAVSYCNEKRNRDPRGHLTEEDARLVCKLSGAKPAVLAELVEKRGFDRDGDGYVVHDFEEYGPPPDPTAAARMRAWRQRQRNGVTGVTRNGDGGYGPPVTRNPLPVPVPMPAGETAPGEHTQPRMGGAGGDDAVMCVDEGGGVVVEENGGDAAALEALGRAFVDELDQVPATRRQRQVWDQALGEMLHPVAGEPVVPAEVPGLVERFRGSYTVPPTPRAIANQLGVLRAIGLAGQGAPVDWGEQTWRPDEPDWGRHLPRPADLYDRGEDV